MRRIVRRLACRAARDVCVCDVGRHGDASPAGCSVARSDARAAVRADDPHSSGKAHALHRHYCSALPHCCASLHDQQGPRDPSIAAAPVLLLPFGSSASASVKPWSDFATRCCRCACSLWWPVPHSLPRAFDHGRSRRPRRGAGAIANFLNCPSAFSAMSRRGQPRALLRLPSHGASAQPKRWALSLPSSRGAALGLLVLAIVISRSMRSPSSNPLERMLG